MSDEEHAALVASLRSLLAEHGTAVVLHALAEAQEAVDDDAWNDARGDAFDRDRD